MGPRMINKVPQQELQVRRLVESGRLAEANALFDAVLAEKAAADPDPWRRAAVLLNRGVCAWRLGRIPLALELAAEGWVELEHEPAEGAAAAETIGLLGYLLESIGHRRPALDMFRRALRLARSAGDIETLVIALQRVGGGLNHRAHMGELGAAHVLFSEAHGVLTEAVAIAPEDSPMRAKVLATHAGSLAGIGELEEAEKQAVAAEELATEREDLWAAALAHWTLAGIRRSQRRLDEARTLASRAVVTAQRVADTNMLNAFALTMARICAEMGDHVGESEALRMVHSGHRKVIDTLQEGLGQALEQRRLAVQAQRLAFAAKQAAHRDSLTGLVNRRGLEIQAPALLERTAARGQVPWLVLVDVDWFKGVNDNAGHAAGDIALREIATLLRQETRSDDLVSRWAGDEFIVLLVGSGEDRRDAGPVVAERIRAAVAGHQWNQVLSGDRQPTVSVGVAGGPAQLDLLFAAADMALYRAKRQGRNRVEVHSPEEQEQVEGGPLPHRRPRTARS
ncbi:GGDEF domain-containing protein [Pseudonocardiaceae bacterium YIM PH 21723]|nr:GGDEF domain-containing protein [Pseudonocardiaceae bacterium YIM PH 21723]